MLLHSPQTTAFFSATTIQVNGGSFTMHNQHQDVTNDGWKCLCENVAYGALHNSAERYDPPKCHPGTREAIIRKIIEWIQNLVTRMQLIMWIYGPAGSGKSAIAQTIAEECQKLGILTFSFFFSRTAPRRNNDRSLVATLAFQFCTLIPEMRQVVAEAMSTDPSILDRSSFAQLEQLIIAPLKYITQNDAIHQRLSSRPSLIIIDGLDEVNDRSSQQRILAALSAAAPQFNIPLVILIASRPELEIRTAFASNPLRELTHSLPLDDTYNPDHDIYLYLKSKFYEIKESHIIGRHLPAIWPDEEELRALVRKSSGQFIYASTVLKYTESPRHSPRERLHDVLGLSRGREWETPFAHLDALYCQILASTPDLERVMEILAYLIYADNGLVPGRTFDYYTSLRVINNNLGYKAGEVELILCDMHALLRVPEWDISTVDFYHASFADFLMDKARSKEYFLDPEKAHVDLTLKSIRSILNTPASSQNSLAIQLHFFFQHCTCSRLTSQLISHLLKLDVFSLTLQFQEPMFGIKTWLRFKEWLAGECCAFDAGKELLKYHTSTEDYWYQTNFGHLAADAATLFTLSLEMRPAAYTFAEVLFATIGGAQRAGAGTNILTYLITTPHGIKGGNQLDTDLQHSLRRYFDDQSHHETCQFNDAQYALLCKDVIMCLLQPESEISSRQRYLRIKHNYFLNKTLAMALPLAKTDIELAEMLRKHVLPMHRAMKFPVDGLWSRLVDNELEYVNRCTNQFDRYQGTKGWNPLSPDIHRVACVHKEDMREAQYKYYQRGQWRLIDYRALSTYLSCRTCRRQRAYRACRTYLLCRKLAKL